MIEKRGEEMKGGRGGRRMLHRRTKEEIDNDSYVMHFLNLF